MQFSDVTPTPAGPRTSPPCTWTSSRARCWRLQRAGARTAGDVIMAWVAPLHVGNFGGFGIRLAWAILGLAPALLFVTGFIMWWTRVVKPRWLSQRENRATQPAATLGAALMLAMAAGHSPAAQHQWDLPPRVAAPRVPAEWPMTPARVELGRRLFYDTRLSGNGTQSCGTCHLQERAFTDGRALGLGSTGMLHARSPMSLVNTAYRDALTWANPTLRTLETQVLVPLLGTTPVEFGHGWPRTARLRRAGSRPHLSTALRRGVPRGRQRRDHAERRGGAVGFRGRGLRVPQHGAVQPARSDHVPCRQHRAVPNIQRSSRTWASSAFRPCGTSP